MYRWKIITNDGGGEPGKVWWWMMRVRMSFLTASSDKATLYPTREAAKADIDEIERFMVAQQGLEKEMWERKLEEVKVSSSPGIEATERYLDEEDALRDLCRAFTEAMFERLKEQHDDEGRCGWREMGPEQIWTEIQAHVTKGDPVDIANFCAFAWYNERKEDQP